MNDDGPYRRAHPAAGPITCRFPSLAGSLVSREISGYPSRGEHAPKWGLPRTSKARPICHSRNRPAFMR